MPGAERRLHGQSGVAGTQGVILRVMGIPITALPTMTLEDILRKWKKQGPTEGIHIVGITGTLHLITQLCCTLARVASPAIRAKGYCGKRAFEFPLRLIPI
jgi:hypothetical protein